MIQVTYQKRNGDLIQRIRNTVVPYRIGETTSMGWKVIDIQIKYNNKLYSQIEYHRIVQKRKLKYIRKQQIKKSVPKRNAFLILFFDISYNPLFYKNKDRNLISS